jgi:hypothetical protein
MSNRIRVRSTIGRGWVWELLTPDGHVASGSDPFVDRAACEADALEQGLPVAGLRKTSAAEAKPRVAGLNICDDTRGIWRWECVDGRGRTVSASKVAFLTREECVQDAELRAPCAAADAGPDAPDGVALGG